MVRDQSAAPRAALSPSSRRRWRRYLRETPRPIHTLAFLLPWVIVYEIGLWWLMRTGTPARELLADSMIQGFLAWFGIVGFWVPGAVLLGTLIAWQFLQGERWRVRGWVPPAMLLESLVLAVPLLVISGLFAPAPEADTSGIGARLVLALGAGLYEELVFRFLLISGLLWLTAEVFELRGPAGVVLAVLAAAAMFAACHFSPIGAEPFDWRTFWFKLVAGGYLGLVFLGRGLGVVCGCHAAYNVVLVWWRAGG